MPVDAVHLPMHVHAPFPKRERQLHNALWLLQHCAGSRVAGLFSGVRARVDQELAASISVPGGFQPVPTEEQSPRTVDGLCPHPVVYRGAAREWGCTRHWSPAFFAERFGDTPIRLLKMAPGDAETEDFTATECSLRDAMERLDEGDRSYCRFLPTVMEQPELQSHLDLNWLRQRIGRPGMKQENVQLFIGGVGTSTATHTAMSGNLFVQAHGRKRWTLIGPDWSWALEPPVQRSVYFMSAFDPDAPDYIRFPAARGIRGYTVELEAGDVLYNPPFWWHKVANPTVSIGCGFRFMPVRSMWAQSRTMTLLTALSTNPPLITGRMLGLDFTRIFTTARRSKPR